MSLQPYYLTITKWHAGLQPRERILVAVLGTLLLCVLVWLALLRPLEHAKQGGAQHYLAAQEDLAWMQAHVQQAQAMAAAHKAKNIPAGGSLISVVTDSAKAHQVTISHASPAQDGSLRLSLTNVAFADLLTWLEGLHTDYAVEAREISISRLPKTPGYVSATLVLHAQ